LLLQRVLTPLYLDNAIYHDRADYVVNESKSIIVPFIQLSIRFTGGSIVIS